MKIKDIITERADFSKATRMATPGLRDWPALDNGNVPYLQYRFGLLMAGAPDIQADSTGAVEGHLYATAYTEAEEEILRAASKFMGVTSRRRSGKGSKELESTYKTSPVQARGPIALKKKK
jgi:hypothetical protein